MSKPLTLAEIAADAGTLKVPEAIALVLAVADQSIQVDGTWRALPSSENILLSPSGGVSFAEAGEEISESDHVKMLAGLLKALLGVDHAAHRPHAPGGLLVLIARACGTMDLDVPSHAAFREALLRFGSADERALSSLYWRNISHRPTTHRASDLRKGARDLELELFRTLVPTEASRPVSSGRTRRAVAAALALAALAASFMIGMNVAGPEHRSPDASSTTARTASQRPAGAPAPTPRAADENLQTPATGASPLLSASAIGADVFSPSFIEHGHALLFHAGRARSSLMRLSLDDPQHATVATVLQDGATNYHAVRSPDGRWLAYDSDRDGTRAVYVALVDGHELKKVSGDGYAAVPRWSPDGRKLAFVKGEPRRPRVWNVWVADLGSDSLTRVSHHTVGQAWGASWFPGGTRLAYSVEDRLIVSDLARGTRRVIQSPRPGHLVRTPAVSPDGKWIVFQVHRDGAWLLEVATGRMRRVLADATAEEFAWSPDSRRVVYHTHRGGGWSLWQLELGRTAATPVVTSTSGQTRPRTTS